ncbi:MAG: hypothetical protein WC471_04525 [Candidatus Woesearchaeota archaeon]
MTSNPWGFSFKPTNFVNPLSGPDKKKRKTLTLRQRLYIWERPNQYGRKCSICNNRITKLSDLELDHTRAHSKGGTKLALAHKECNKLKGSGSLGKIQKILGIKKTKRKIIKKTTKRKSISHFGFPSFKMPRLRI